MNMPVLPTIILLATTGALTWLFVAGIIQAGRTLDESPAVTRRWAAGAALGVALWLAVSAGAAQSGILSDFGRFPPPMLVLAGLAALLALGLALSQIGKRLVLGISLAALIGFQAFRLLVEIMLAQLFHAGALPVQMTFEGRNFDIISGLSAIAVAWLAYRRRLPNWALLLWNLAGLALLINIVVISVLSMPLPVRAFFNEPANVIVTTWPFVWLPVFLVQAALFGHLLVFRSLWMSRNSGESRAELQDPRMAEPLSR
jgi:hypothetical protein